MWEGAGYKALLGKEFWTGLGEDFKSGSRFCKFTFKAEAGESGWGGQVGLLRAGDLPGGASCFGPGCLTLSV